MVLESNSHSVGQLVYHLEWAPKYRYEMMRKPENAALCEKAIRQMAERHGIRIVELSVMPEHIHVAAHIPSNMTVAMAEQLLKGGSSYLLFRWKPNFRKRYPKGHFWSPGKFHRTVGDTDLSTTVKYIQDQKIHQTTLTQFAP
jgi:putative transposase